MKWIYERWKTIIQLPALFVPLSVAKHFCFLKSLYKKKYTESVYTMTADTKLWDQTEIKMMVIWSL